MKSGIFIILAMMLAPIVGQAEEIHATSNDVKLAGELLLPDASVCGKCPVIIIAQGSGNSDRSNPWTAAWANLLREHGVAVLNTDKRGSGKSGGDWRTVGLEQLADDIAAFVDAVSTHRRIDRARIGVMGFSQGGHVVSVLADVSEEVDFVISLSASVVPLGEQILDETLLQGRADGLTEKQLAALNRVHVAAMAYADGEVSFEEVDDALGEAGNAGLVEYGFVKDFPRADVEWLWPWLSMVKDFDPMSRWLNANKPVLFIYGGKDRNVDVRKSVALIQEKLMNKAAAVTLLVHDENGHALFRNDTVAMVAAYARHGGEND